jgi:putative MATE family efflux protein
MALTVLAKGSKSRPAQVSVAHFDARTRRLIEAPITATLLRLAAPNVLVMVAQASVGLIETYFVGKLGTDALAGVALVFPVLMLMQMMSAGAVGGGISSAIARALGAGRREDADSLTLHALAIAVMFGLVFTLGVLGGGSRLYAAMGGSGLSLTAALTYSNVIFSNAILIWIFNSLANVIRGTGNMAVPATVTCAGTAALIPLSPALIFGWGPFPRLDIAGGAAAVVCFYALGSLVLLAYLATGRSVVRLSLRGNNLRWTSFWDILRVGGIAALVTIGTNLTIGISTGLVGRFGPAAIAGYGTGARLEYLLVPLVFGLGAPLVAMVGTNIGAGERERALRTAWIGAAIAAGLCEAIGLCAAAFPRAWLALFDSDPAMLEAGARYLRTVGPTYGLFGLGMALYFASQGAARLFWPLLANLTRLAIAAGGGWFALRWSSNLSEVFVAQAAALATFGLIVAAAVAGGGWFGRLSWSWRRDDRETSRTLPSARPTVPVARENVLPNRRIYSHMQTRG